MNPLLWLIQLPFRPGQRRWNQRHPSIQTPAPPPFASPSGGGAGPAPVPGQQAIPVPAHGRPPRPAPAPATRPRLLMTSRFYSDGVVYVDDHIRHTTRRFAPPPGADDWDAAFERRQAGDHPDGF